MAEPSIHQYIFAGPRPGLTAQAFQSYWVNFHAVDFAAKIPQIRRYLVATREQVEAPRQVDFFQGVAEIWLQNDEEQIASLQTPEFLQGARIDEPRWAAFWQTFVLDTESTVIKESGTEGEEFVNLYMLTKRIPLMKEIEFAEKIHSHARATVELNGDIRRCVVGLARKALYGFGEPRFDGIEVWSFDGTAEAANALAETDELEFADPRYVFGMIAKEHWIIRSGTR